MKQQIGVRVDSKLWSQFKELCSQAHLKPNEAIEAFFKVCLTQGVKETINQLEGLNIGEQKALKLKLQNMLMELEAYYVYDAKNNQAEKYFYVREILQSIAKLLPKIKDELFIRNVENKLQEVLAYYQKFFERGEQPPDEVI